ncbi:Leucine Rich repeat, putative [Angomonas deanei]|uniref:Leucine Rich repeat, putative n=1 Tax=Angomonas deanei TaxID=59799 RepID=A0A7G2CNW1_9TRYP|nr:Leucine Rich repeat, putative [Angomonas deanei]
MTSDTVLALYAQECKTLGINVNSALARLLSVYSTSTQKRRSESTSVSGDFSLENALRVVYLRDNLIGSNGLRALFPVLVHFSYCLHTVDLSYNQLDNDAIIDLAYLFHKGFPSLKKVDVSGNPFTFRAAKCLADMCEGIKPFLVHPENVERIAQYPRPATKQKQKELASSSMSNTDVLPKLLRDRMTGVGLDNNIATVLLANTLMTSVQEDCVLLRIANATARRNERKRRYQIDRILRSSSVEGSKTNRSRQANRPPAEFTSPLNILEDSAPSQQSASTTLYGEETPLSSGCLTASETLGTLREVSHTLPNVSETVYKTAPERPETVARPPPSMFFREEESEEEEEEEEESKHSSTVEGGSEEEEEEEPQYGDDFDSEASGEASDV